MISWCMSIRFCSSSSVGWKFLSMPYLHKSRNKKAGIANKNLNQQWADKPCMVSSACFGISNSFWLLQLAAGGVELGSMYYHSRRNTPPLKMHPL